MIEAPEKLLPVEPGIYEGISFAQYASWPAVNKSRLDWLYDWAPLHCKYRMDHPEEDTPALIVGRALHSLVLTPDDYESEFAIAPECDKRTKDGKAMWAAFCQQAGERSVLTTDQDELVKNMARAISFCTAAHRFIASEGRNELSIIWNDQLTGLLCKARLDMERKKDWNCIGDLKTTISGNIDDFTRSLTTYGYYRQAAFYLAGAKAVGLELDAFAIVAVEKTAPYGVATFQVDKAAIEIGQAQNQRLMATYAACERFNSWPGYTDEFKLISISPWEMRKAWNEMNI